MSVVSIYPYLAPFCHYQPTPTAPLLVYRPSSSPSTTGESAAGCPTSWSRSCYTSHRSVTNRPPHRPLAGLQAIFLSVYHWGIHGWVPYILVALVCRIYLSI